MYNISMCEISEIIGYGKCPDPIFWDNVMYSGHLAQIMTLYETFSNDFSLSTKGWVFYENKYKKLNKRPSKYTLKKLIKILTFQKKISPISAFSCEPTIVYTVCNQHPVIASLLYDSLHNTSYFKKGEPSKYFNWIKTNGTHNFTKNNSLNISYPSLKDSFYVGLTQINMESIMKLKPKLRQFLRKLIKNRDGLVGLDGWVNQWLEIWRPQNSNGINLLTYARNHLIFNKAWKKFIVNTTKKDLWYIENDILSTLGMFNFTIATATSFSIAGMGGYSDINSNKSLVEGAINFLDYCTGKKYISKYTNLPMWYYDTQSGNILNQCINSNKKINKQRSVDNILNTANILQGMVYDPEILRSLYNGTLIKESYNNPHIELLDNEYIGIRIAKYFKNKTTSIGILKIILTSMISKLSNITCNLYIKIPKRFMNINSNYLLQKYNCANLKNRLKCKISFKNSIRIELFFKKKNNI